MAMDLKTKFFMLHMFETELKRTPIRDEKIKELKHEIRSYLKLKDPEDEKVLVKDFGIDGCIVRFPVPESCETKEDMTEWFEEWEYIKYRPSMYDCTGQMFTAGYEFHKLNGRMWVWHHIGVDV